MKSILFFVQMRDGIPPVWGHKPPKHEQSLARDSARLCTLYRWRLPLWLLSLQPQP